MSFSCVGPTNRSNRSDYLERLVSDRWIQTHQNKDKSIPFIESYMDLEKTYHELNWSSTWVYDDFANQLVRLLEFRNNATLNLTYDQFDQVATDFCDPVDMRD